MKIDFEKMGGLVPAIIQDAVTQKVLMLGFMNEEAYQKTLDTKHVTFWSRTRNTLWTKGETSGNFLNLVDIRDRHLLGRRESCQSPTLLNGIAGLYQSQKRRDARRFVHHETLQGRHQ